LAKALVLVLQKGEDRETYLVAGEDALTLNEFCETAKEALGKKGKMKHLPSLLAIVMGKVLGMSLLTKENIRHLSKERLYDLKKIKALGYKQKRSMKDSIIDTIETLKRKELL